MFAAARAAPLARLLLEPDVAAVAEPDRIDTVHTGAPVMLAIDHVVQNDAPDGAIAGL